MTRNKVLIASFVVASLLVNMGFTLAPAPSQTRQIIDTMLDAIARHRTAAFIMDASERIVGKPKETYFTEIFTRVYISPLKIYGKVLKDPNKGTQLLYVTGAHDNKIRVKSGWLPIVSLSPTSGLLTKNQHHTLLSSGFMIVNKIVGDGEKRADARGKFDEVFKYVGDVTYRGRSCYKVTIDDPTYAYTTAVGQKGENVVAMAHRLSVSEYHIMDLNSRSLDDDVAGKTLKVPSSYAKSSVLYIDKETHFPIYQEMSDERGIYEKYEYSNVVINPQFGDKDFSEDSF